jgi:hypothetical protein
MLHQQVSKAQVSIVAKAITSYLNLIVITCTMNQSKGH